MLLSYANQYTKPFNDISSVVTEFQNALACAARIMEFIEEEPVPADPEGALQPSHLDGKVELQHIRFSYLPDRKLIEDLSVDVKPGMRVAIVGPTGCGKTTLINLLMRFYDVQGGQITIDGTPVQQIGCKALRKNFGMVLQDTWLKCGSILENIRMGNPGASYDEVVAAAKKHTPTALFSVCRRGIIPRSVRTAAACLKGKSSCFVSPALCCAIRLC